VIICLRHVRKYLSRKRSLATFVLLTNIAFFSLGCTVKVPIEPDVGKIEVKEKFPVEAGLLITEETKNYIFTGKPESFTGGGRPHEFPLGEALEKASGQTFSQVFQKVSLVRTSSEIKKYKTCHDPNNIIAGSW